MKRWHKPKFRLKEYDENDTYPNVCDLDFHQKLSSINCHEKTWFDFKTESEKRLFGTTLN